MGVHKNLGPPLLKQRRKRARIARVLLHKIAVQIQVARIAPKAVGLRPVLVHAGGAVAVQHAVDIVGRNDNHRYPLQQG